MNFPSRHYLVVLAVVCHWQFVADANHVPIRLPMEVFGANSTHVNSSTTTTTTEDRKMMMLRHKLLLNNLGGATDLVAPSSLPGEQRRGRQLSDDMVAVRSARVLYQIGVSPHLSHFICSM